MGVGGSLGWGEWVDNRVVPIEEGVGGCASLNKGWTHTTG